MVQENSVRLTCSYTHYPCSKYQFVNKSRPEKETRKPEGYTLYCYWKPIVTSESDEGKKGKEKGMKKGDIALK